MNWLKRIFSKKRSEAESENIVSESSKNGTESQQKEEFGNEEATISSSKIVSGSGQTGSDKQSTSHTKGEANHEAKALKDGEANDGLMVHHLIVLDESGSMSSVRQQTVDGCNETIQTVRNMQEMNADQKHYVSIYMFQTGASRYILKDVPISEVRELRLKDYRPGASTPLFDAIGFTLTELKQKLGDGVAAYVTIITDGYENDSRHYDLQMVRSLISEMKECNVIFSFIGANIDSKQYAQSMGIDNSLQFTADSEGAKDMWKREARAKMRSSSRMAFSRKFDSVDRRERFYKEENLGAYYDEDVDPRRVTPRQITSLRPDEIFVFGSNTAGKHDGGAARYALEHFGAVYSQAEGPQGQSYAIPTVGLDEEQMYEAVQRFIEYAHRRSDLTFLVTPIGCGNAGLSPYMVAPMFRDAVNMPNVKLPQEFWNFL